MNKKSALAITAALLLSACATPVIHNTPSGKPEATVDATPEFLKPVLVNAMTNGGWTIFKDTTYQMAFDKPVTNIFAAALMGSRYDAQPDERVTYTFAPLGAQTRIVGDVAIITNPGSAFERVTPINNSPDSGELQKALDNIKTAMTPSTPANRRLGIEMRRGPGLPTVVAGVLPGGAAAQAGMQTGDLIEVVDGTPIHSYDEMGAAITKGTSPDIIVSVRRAGETKDLHIHFGG